jgi:hypothetical protein
MICTFFKHALNCHSYADVPASFDDAIQKRMQNARRKNGPSLPKSVLDIEDICTRFDDYG